MNMEVVVAVVGEGIQRYHRDPCRFVGIWRMLSGRAVGRAGGPVGRQGRSYQLEGAGCSDRVQHEYLWSVCIIIVDHFCVYLG